VRAWNRDSDLGLASGRGHEHCDCAKTVVKKSREVKGDIEQAPVYPRRGSETYSCYPFNWYLSSRIAKLLGQQGMCPIESAY
jgi:hypothetical protein